jgi:hypothetical protein
VSRLLPPLNRSSSVRRAGDPDGLTAAGRHISAGSHHTQISRCFCIRRQAGQLRRAISWSASFSYRLTSGTCDATVAPLCRHNGAVLASLLCWGRGLESSIGVVEMFVTAVGAVSDGLSTGCRVYSNLNIATLKLDAEIIRTYGCVI